MLLRNEMFMIKLNLVFDMHHHLEIFHKTLNFYKTLNT